MVSIYDPETPQESLRQSMSRDALSLKHGNSAASSRVSLDFDEENDTITSSRPLVKANGNGNGIKKDSQDQEDLTFLAISTHMTEISYSISDIQTRIFEIQELRHKSQASGDMTNTSNTIDQSLITLDERIETVSKGMKAINDALEPHHQAAPTPTIANTKNATAEHTSILRKHLTLVAEWEAVQDESETLREELKEDKWLTVFRTVTDQADGMMSSLEKAVNRCQEFIWQVHRFGSNSQSSLSTSHAIGSEAAPPTLETFNSLMESFEAKKKHYMPATSKVLSIIDRGVQDRVTKNGETLRRHAESAQRWKTLKKKITRVEADMEAVRKILNGEETPSEVGSSASTNFSKKNGYLATPPSGGRGSAASTISRSMSPLRKFARKITGGSSKLSPQPPPVTPLSINKTVRRTPSSEPVGTFGRKSIFSFKSQPPTPTTPDRPGHKHSYSSFTPDPSPQETRNGAHSSADVHPTVKGPLKHRWNSSTKVEDTGTLKGTPPRRPSISGLYGSDDYIPPVPSLYAQFNRSTSRMSNVSAGPWTPYASTSTAATSTASPSKPRSASRSATNAGTFSRAETPSRAQTPSRSFTPVTISPPMPPTPRGRPQTPSQIPAPAKFRNFSSTQSEGGWDQDVYDRSHSPAFSASGRSAYAGAGIPPRPPSRSMIPVPRLSLSSASRPGSSLSQYGSPSTPFKLSAMRSQTPEASLMAKVSQVPFYGASRTRPPSTVPPSSFRDAGTRTPVGSRPSSRSGAYTPNPFDDAPQSPLHPYSPGNLKDPLDVEVARIVNAIPHGLLIERIDPPLRGPPPKDGEEVRAQYAFSNALSRKVVTCRLTTMVRTSIKNGGGPTSTKKVMCRVGGGWQDLQLYMLSRLEVG